MPKAHKGPVSKSQKVIHPNSRTAGYMKRQNAHFEKVFKSKSVTSEKNERLRQKLQWFQENMDPHKTVFTKHDLAELTSDYLDRFKGELEQISIINSIGNRKSKQHVSRSEAIRLTQEREKKEFEGGGIEVPNLLNKASCDYFRNWSGEVRYFPNIKLFLSRKADIEKKKQDNGKKRSDSVQKVTVNDQVKSGIDQEKLGDDQEKDNAEAMEAESSSSGNAD